MLLFFHANQGIPVENVDLQSLLMFLNRHAEMILPAVQVRRLAGSLSLFIAILINLNGSRINLRGIQVKDKQVLALTANELADDFIAVLGIPAHHGHDLAKE